MPRELDVYGVYVPSLLAAFVMVGVCFWLVDGVLARLGVYRWVWHIDLFRLALFVLLFSACGNYLYR